MSETCKPTTWTRWAVVVTATDPVQTYYAIKQQVPDSERFCIRSMGIKNSEVRLVAEYTAAGANGDDVKRRLMAAGINRSDISASKVASIETDRPFNADVLQAIGRVPSPFA